MKMRVPGTRLNSKEKRPLLRMEIAGNKVPTLDENCMSSVNCSSAHAVNTDQILFDQILFLSGIICVLLDHSFVNKFI